MYFKKLNPEKTKNCTDHTYIAWSNLKAFDVTVTYKTYIFIKHCTI